MRCRRSATHQRKIAKAGSRREAVAPFRHTRANLSWSELSPAAHLSHQRRLFGKADACGDFAHRHASRLQQPDRDTDALAHVGDQGGRGCLGSSRGGVAQVDLLPHLWGTVLEPLRDDHALFARVRVDADERNDRSAQWHRWCAGDAT